MKQQRNQIIQEQKIILIKIIKIIDNKIIIIKNHTL